MADKGFPANGVPENTYGFQNGMPVPFWILVAKKDLQNEYWAVTSFPTTCPGG